jgi:hypothetical protein
LFGIYNKSLALILGLVVLKAKNASRGIEALKMMYVGFSCPTHLLCFAILTDNSEEDDKKINFPQTTQPFMSITAYRMMPLL